MDDDLHRRIDELVAEEHGLRHAEEKTADTRARLADLEVRLDKAWDLLRQRDALRNAGQDPAAAEERSTSTVEGYLE